MKTAPVVLINPPPPRIVEEYDAPRYGHIGLAYLASALRDAGIGCVILDAKLGRLKPDDVISRALAAGPLVVGITSHTHEIGIASGIAREIKKRSCGIKIVLGGIHASSLPVETLRSFECYDFLVKGEGERAFVELCRALIDDNNGSPEIAGVGSRRGGDVVFTPPSGWIQDLDKIGFPAWDLFPEMSIFPVISSRGCPYKCVFCARMLGETLRVRSPENVVAELEFLRDTFRPKKVYFYDETFGFYRDWLEKFLGLAIKTGAGRDLKWNIATRAQLVEPETLKLLKKAGCLKIDFGVESGDEKILKIIRKGETKEDFIRAARLVKNARLKSHGYFILGHPYETKETAMNTVNFAAELNTDVISIGIMVPYPGTEVARLASAGEGGYKRISADWSDYNKQLANALELESISRLELTRLQMLGYLKFYLKNMKIIPFFAAIWNHRKLIFAIVLKYMRAAAGERSFKGRKVR